MAELTAGQIRVWATQQIALLQRLAEDATALAALRGDSPYPLSLPTNHTVMKRRTKKADTNGEEKKPKQKRGKRAKFRPEAGNRTEDYVTRVLADARKPMGIHALTDGMLAAGWTSTGNAKNVVSQALYVMRINKRVKRFGKSPNSTWGFTNWKAAVRAAKVYAESNGSGASA